MTVSWELEHEAVCCGDTLICGADEAGRGCLAGPVYAAAVILPLGLVIPGLRDSKRLSEKKREALFQIITKNAVSYAVASVDNTVIDKTNILSASQAAMNLAIENLGVKPDIALIDGNYNKEIKIKSRCVIGGDDKSASIAAASILAKVSRDRYMCKIAHEYPEYLFERHKGYATALHKECISKYGLSAIHRTTFKIKK